MDPEQANPEQANPEQANPKGVPAAQGSTEGAEVPVTELN